MWSAEGDESLELSRLGVRFLKSPNNQSSERVSYERRVLVRGMLGNEP